jgi:hypothetical protein
MQGGGILKTHAICRGRAVGNGFFIVLFVSGGFMGVGSIVRAAIAAAVVFTLSPARGQSAGEVSVDEQGLCPAESVLRKFPGVTQPSVGVGSTLTKLPGAALERSQDGNQTVGAALPFNTALTVFGFSANQRKLFVRTRPGAASVPFCGWISTEKVLIPRENKFAGRYKVPQPLQMRDISESQKATENLLNVKAVVHDLSIIGEAKGIDIFQDPASGNATDKIRLFDAFLVFAELNLPSSDPKQETRYWLIGERLDNGVTTSLKGWIRQRDVVIWPSRLAVQWNEDATVSGYSTPDNLSRKTGQMTLPERIERADYLEQITRRLPVLEQAPPPEEIFNKLPPGGSLEERAAVARKMINYYKIATPGNACRKDNPADCLSARQIDLKREKVATLEKSALRMDILILIDATESMDPYFASTVHTIERLIKLTEEEGIRTLFDLRFGISLYGDYQTGEANADKVDYREIVPFFKPAPGPLGTSGAMLTLVKDPKSLVFKDVHRDKLEAPYAGVIRATKSVKWRPLKEVPLRFVVHVGDSGNRDPGLTAGETQRARYPNAPENTGAPPQSTIREQYGEKDVAGILRDASVIYIPVVIENGSVQNPAPTMWNQIFRDQADKIISLLGVNAPIKKTLTAHSLQLSNEIEKLVAETILTILEKVAVGIDYQKCGTNSKSEKCENLKQKYEVEIKKPEIVQLVNRVASVAAGLTGDEINNIYSRDQSIVTMYSPAQSVEGKEMFTHWVALEQNEFKQLRELLTKLCTSMSKQDSKSPVLSALQAFSQMYSNEDFRDLTVREILGKRLGIPNLERTDFSGRTSDEIDDAYRAWQNGEKTTWDNWHTRVCRATTFTQLMEDDKKIDPALIKCNLDDNTCEAPEAAQRKFRWNVRVSQDVPTYYVPLDVLP